MRAWLIDNFGRLVSPFAGTIGMLPAGRVSVISGAGGDRPPLSAVTPDALALARNELIAGALSTKEPAK